MTAALLGLQKRLGGSRRVAVAVMTVLLALVLAAPIAAVILTLVDKADAVYAWVKDPSNLAIPPPRGRSAHSL